MFSVRLRIIWKSRDEHSIFIDITQEPALCISNRVLVTQVKNGLPHYLNASEGFSTPHGLWDVQECKKMNNHHRLVAKISLMKKKVESSTLCRKKIEICLKFFRKVIFYRINRLIFKFEPQIRGRWARKPPHTDFPVKFMRRKIFGSKGWNSDADSIMFA